MEYRKKYLFASLGERGKGNIAQDVKSHPGRIIRIHLDGSIPIHNPKFVSNPEWQPEIYQIGVRNPQGITISPLNNKIYISNHGPRGGDFVGVVDFAGNYGWKLWCWGGRNYNFTRCGEKHEHENGFTQPIHTWVPSIAISSIQVYKGKEFKNWRNKFLIASLKDKSLRVLDLNDPKEIKKEEIIFKDKIGEIRDFKISRQGKIYLLTIKKPALWVIKNTK